MSLKIKLISCISLFMLMVGVLIIGVFAATQQQLTMEGSVSFVVPDKSLYVKDVRIKQDMASEPSSIDSFMPGYINENFTLDLTGITDTNTYGSFTLYFDIINTTESYWQITDVDLGSLADDGVSEEHGGIISVNDLIDTDSDGYKNFDSNTPIDGTLILTITAPNSSSVNLEGIVITIDEYIDAAVQVTSVSSSGVTTDTYTDLAGGVAIDGSLDLSSIEFAAGETTLTIPMTSLSANYIKNKVSWVNTNGVTISSTSLYLPQNSSGQLTSGESRDLKIYVNNTSGSTTTISGLEVEFEEKEDLLQVTEEDETSTYTGEGYWYVEMGTYSTTSDNAEGKRESEYLRWRYFAKEKTPYNADTETAPVAYHYEFDRNTRPTREGYFILESYFSSFASRNEGGLYCSWNNDYKNSSPYKHQLNGWKNIDANDYSTSTVRQYMNSEELVYKSYSPSNSIYSPSGTQSNMFTDLHIDPDNDIIYTDIIGRTLSDLYTNMGWDGNTSSPTFSNVDFPKGSPNDWSGAKITYSEDDTDKFWLLSYYEAYHLLGADTTSSDTDRKWGNFYWLRSPSSSRSSSVYVINTSGNLGSNSVKNFISAVRAAFKFSI